MFHTAAALVKQAHVGTMVLTWQTESRWILQYRKSYLSSGDNHLYNQTLSKTRLKFCKAYRLTSDCKVLSERQTAHLRRNAETVLLITTVKYHSCGRPWGRVSTMCPTVRLGGGWKQRTASRASVDRFNRARLRSYRA